MGHTTHTRSLLLALMLLGFTAPAAAQISGDLVEPNVMILLDSGAGMEWLRETGERPDAYTGWEWSERVCGGTETSSDPLTSWQKVQEALLGSTGSNGKCVVEPWSVRPSLSGLERSEWEAANLLTVGAGGFVENISEFRTSSRKHMRRVGCAADYWHLNGTADMRQCIKLAADPGYVANPANPAYVAGVDGPTSTVMFGAGSYSTELYCRTDDADNINDLCWNFHPAAEPRLSNGILERYDGLARFGSMTMDNGPRCTTGTFAAPCDPHTTLWDYGDSRIWGEVPIGYVNAGSRGDDPGAIGALVRIGDGSNAAVRASLMTMEPVGCSPVAAMVDDAGYYFATDPGALPSGFSITKQDPRFPTATAGTDKYYRCRPKIAMLLTDGDPGVDLEHPSGACNTTNDDADWDPLNPDAAVQATSFDCRWRSSPEEAWELFDVGKRLLDGHVAGLGDTVGPEDEPLFLVVVGFNVPESCADVNDDPNCNPSESTCKNRRARCIDCTCIPTAIVDPVARAACERGLTKCLAYTDAYNDRRCFVDACPAASTCLMTPREFLNEVACQGWPWNIPAAGGASGHTTATPPPWLDPALPADMRICEDPSAANPRPICTVSQGHSLHDRGDRALFAESPTDLAKAMDLILGSLASTVATRTDVVTWNVPAESAALTWAVGATEVERQYEFNSGYVAQAGRPWRGALKRTAFECDGATVATPGAVSNISAQVSSQLARRIYTPLLGGLDSGDYAQPENATGGTLNWVRGAGNLQELVPLGDRQLNDCDYTEGEVVGLCNSDTDTDAEHPIQDAVVEFTEERGLADIYNSTPAVLGPPTDELPNPSYGLYRSEKEGRHPFLFVSTNDGLLHAFDITAMKEDAAPVGDVESWAFVPRAVLSQLWQQYPISVEVNGPTYTVSSGTEAGLFQHLFLGDGPPLAMDALLFQNPATLNPTATKDYWRAVVLSGLGKGARGYYALDVTDAVSAVTGPTSTRLLRWEIAPDAGLWGNNGAAAQAQLSKMGRSVSRPALAYVHYEPAGGIEGQYAAAILPGGFNTEDGPTGNTGVYVVRLGDGKLIRYLEPNAADTGDMCSGSPGLKEEAGVIVESVQLIGEPAVPFGARQAQVTTSAFIGDDRGRLWKLHMADDDPADWCLELFFDTLLAWDYPYEDCTAGCTPAADCYHVDCCSGSAADKPCATNPNAPRNMDAPRLAVLGAPTIAQNKDGKNVIVFGLGSLNSLATWNRNRVFSITEGGYTDIEDTDLADTDTGEITGESTAVNWWIGDPLTAGAVSDPDWSSWHSAIRNKMNGKQVNPAYTGLQGQTFFNVGEKLVGRPVVFNEVAYFTTFLPVSDPSQDDACESGGSRIWGVDYEDRAGENGAIEAAYNADDFGKMSSGANKAMFIEAPYQGALLSGVKVVARPRCDGGIGYDVYEITAQKANPSYQQGQSNVVSDAAVTAVAQRLGTAATPLSRVVRFDSWSIVFE